ncbi:MAG: hypothetical protein M3O02_05430 [Acidobacteriota bacterium]|nr:hypothetical protein [Acidobacteriota bacterium]
MNCSTCQNVLPNLLLEPGAVGNVAARAHLATCAVCAKELASLEATVALLDAWEAPEISPYFDQKLAVRLRESQASAPASWYERLRDRLQLNTGAQFRPALAGALAVAAIVAGGGVGLTTYTHPAAIHASATVNDLQLLERNAQTLQQVDQILQEDASQEPDRSAPPES